ncbi:hypothetical protein ACFWXK_23460 [Streptomyces sp. NPDC059070]|uniref:hypothetical protein n=1 Tax=unclassified Streptomyces TaxID=2593676 RepID=UPI0034E2851D
MTAVITLTTADRQPTDVVDVDVDFDLALDGDEPSAPAGPPPQISQMDFRLDASTVDPAPVSEQGHVQLVAPILIDPLPPQVTQLVIDYADTAETV